MIPFGDVHWSEVRGRPSWRWATVTATTPTLELTVEGDEEPLEVPPTVLAHVGPLAVADKVWTQIIPGGAIVVIGKAA